MQKPLLLSDFLFSNRNDAELLYVDIFNRIKNFNVDALKIKDKQLFGIDEERTTDRLFIADIAVSFVMLALDNVSVSEQAFLDFLRINVVDCSEHEKKQKLKEFVKKYFSHCGIKNDV